jgi:hypothetical protein
MATMPRREKAERSAGAGFFTALIMLRHIRKKCHIRAVERQRPTKIDRIERTRFHPTILS